MLYAGPLSLITVAFDLYYLIVLIRVIGSWVPPRPGQLGWAKLFSFCYRLTEPLLRPLRTVLFPVTGRLGIDFSPLVLWILLDVVRNIVVRFVVAMFMTG